MAELTQARVRALFNYDPETGLMMWRERPREDFATERSWRIFHSRFSGKPAGSISKFGRGMYRGVHLDGRMYLMHRLIWLYVTGRWPMPYIDHKNLDGTDNRWTNLREASHSQNCINRPRQARTKAGLKGVRKNIKSSRFSARIGVNGIQLYLGTFDTPDEAHAAYLAAATAHHGEFARE